VSAGHVRETKRSLDLSALEHHFTGFKRGDEKALKTHHDTKHQELEHDNRDPKSYSAVDSHTAYPVKERLGTTRRAVLVV